MDEIAKYKLYFVIVIIFLTCKGNAQFLNERVITSSNCFNGIMEGQCQDSMERIFVTQLNAGSKFKTLYPDNCTLSWTGSIAEECCIHDNSDCFGEYAAITTDPFVFHKDCVGKQTCSRRAAPRMDTLYLGCDLAIYPAQTSYFEINYHCINVSKIVRINGDTKQNDGHGSGLYMWSGDATTYQTLDATRHECSVETDCDATIDILTLDLRFSLDDENRTCIPEKLLTIVDGDRTLTYNCSSNNEFRIQTLHSSETNYITLFTDNDASGGYLWLAFKPTNSGNLTVNCNSPGPSRDCEVSTTTELMTATEIETTTEVSSHVTSEYISTTDDMLNVTTTDDMMNETTTDDMLNVTTTEVDSTSHDDTTSASVIKAPVVENSKSNVPLVIGLSVGGIAIAAIIIISLCLYKRSKNRRQQTKEKGSVESSERGKDEQIIHPRGTNEFKLEIAATTVRSNSLDQNGILKVNNSLPPISRVPVQRKVQETDDNLSQDSHLPKDNDEEAGKVPPPLVFSDIKDETCQENEKVKVKDRKKKKKKREKLEDDEPSELKSNDEEPRKLKKRKKKRENKIHTTETMPASGNQSVDNPAININRGIDSSETMPALGNESEDNTELHINRGIDSTETMPAPGNESVDNPELHINGGIDSVFSELQDETSQSTKRKKKKKHKTEKKIDESAEENDLDINNENQAARKDEDKKKKKRKKKKKKLVDPPSDDNEITKTDEQLPATAENCSTEVGQNETNEV